MLLFQISSIVHTHVAFVIVVVVTVVDSVVVVVAPALC